MTDLKNLARHVKERRDELDLNQVQVTARGGPSNSTLTAIENAVPPGPSRATLRKLDVGLSWEPGSARRVLDGGTPAPVPVKGNRRHNDELLAELRDAMEKAGVDEGTRDRVIANLAG